MNSERIQQLNEIRKTLQDIKEDFNKYREILKTKIKVTFWN
jgi:hypothetical protein